MSGAEDVVLALGAFEKTGEPALLAKRFELRIAPCQDLVGIALVPDIPDDLVARRLKSVVKGYRELYDPESGADVAARTRTHVNEARTNLLGEQTKLVEAQ